MRYFVQIRRFIGPRFGLCCRIYLSFIESFEVEFGAGYFVLRAVVVWVLISVVVRLWFGEFCRFTLRSECFFGFILLFRFLVGTAHRINFTKLACNLVIKHAHLPLRTQMSYVGGRPSFQRYLLIVVFMYIRSYFLIAIKM